MHFTKYLSAIAFTTTAVSGAAIQKRALTAQQVADQITQLTAISQQLQPTISAIQSGDSIIAKRQGNPFQPVIDGITRVNDAAINDINAMADIQRFANADAQPVCDAFAAFVPAYQSLLNTIIGKSGLLEGIFLGPVAAVLRNNENVLDTFSFGVIDSTPLCEPALYTQKASLDDTLAKAICAYTPAGSLGLQLFC